jgi:hypothetical protein
MNTSNEFPPAHRKRRTPPRIYTPRLSARKSEPASPSPPAIVFTEDDISLGFDDERKKVMVRTIDRCKHMHVIGTTGSGKSAFCVYCILQDIARGRGVCVLDPHGGHPDSVFNQVLASLRNNGWFDTGKVHIIAPNSPEYVVGFNPLAPVGKKDPSVIADAMLEAFQRVWGNENADTKPLMHRILLATFIALSEAHLPLAEASNLLDYEDRSGLRRKLIASTKNPVARDGLEYIQRLAEKRDSSEFNQTVMGPENRLVKFLASDAIRLMFSTTRDRGDRTLDFLEIMDRGDILLVDLQRGDAISGPNCKLLGTIIVRYLFELMASRKELPLPKGERYHPFMVYIDEAHEYLSGDVQKLLTEARKYRLGLTLAHQFVYQLEEAGEAIYHAVQSCTHSKVVFTIQSAQEAQDLAHDVLPLSLETPLQASTRPTAVGTKIGKLKNETRGTQESTNEMRARHHARSTGTTITETEQRSRGRSHGNSFMRGGGSAAISGSGASAGTVDGANSSNSLSMGYDPLSQNFMTPNLPLSMNIGSGDSASHSHIASESSQRSKSLSSYEGTNQSDSTSESEGHGTSYSASIAHMDGESIGAGVAQGTSQSQGVSEAWETIYKPLPGSFHSKEHELYFKGEQIRNLPVGRAIARIGKTTTFLNVPPPRKSNTKPGDASPTALAALIAKTSAAQPREQIIQRREACEQERRQRLSKPTPSDDQLATPEPSRLSATRINTQPIFGSGLTLKEKRSASHLKAQSRAS